jgi:phenylalanyl-tRNA synthetase beta subunit
VDNETSLTDGQVIDRISRLVDSIGKSIERIDKVERKSDFFLTPDGFKIILRTIVELIGLHVKDTEVQSAIRRGLMEASVKTTSGVGKVIEVSHEDVKT